MPRTEETPPVLAVEVKRAPAGGGGTSPFRSTADLAVREAISGSVAIAEPAVLSKEPITGHGGSSESGDFFDHVASRLSDLGEPFAPERATPVVVEPVAPPVTHSEPQGHNRARMEVDRRMPVELPPARGMRQPEPAGELPRRSAAPEANAGGAVAAALVIGGVVGFCAGIVASRWVQL